ncbi:MAG: hypothetical protein HOP19_03880 [Acidobacteria bacterium]|nr:hypothetical protein [Acidobacteriota bacterium]
MQTLAILFLVSIPLVFILAWLLEYWHVCLMIYAGIVLLVVGAFFLLSVIIVATGHGSEVFEKTSITFNQIFLGGLVIIIIFGILALWKLLD